MPSSTSSQTSFSKLLVDNRRSPPLPAYTPPPTSGWQDGLSGKQKADDWCADLGALSSASVSLRGRLRGRSLRVLELPVEEDIDRLEAMVTVPGRGHIRKIIIKPHADPKRPYWTRTKLARFQSFFNTCPNFEELVSRAWTPHPRKIQPSLILPTVTKLAIVSPSIISSTALAKSFPNLQSLHYIETMHQLLIKPDAAGRKGHNCGRCALGIDHIAGLFREPFPSVTEMNLHTYLPSVADPIDPSGLGDKESWMATKAVKNLCGKFPVLRDLTISFPGPVIPSHLAYDWEAMVNWLIALDSPLQHFHLLPQEFSTGPLWLTAYAADLRYSEHLMEDVFYKVISLTGPNRPRGWEPVEEFVASEKAVKQFADRPGGLIALKSLETFRIEHGVRLVRRSPTRGTFYKPAAIQRIQARRVEVWEDGHRVQQWRYGLQDGLDKATCRLVTKPELEQINLHMFRAVMMGIREEGDFVEFEQTAG